jgi:hypothetical protein
MSKTAEEKIEEKRMILMNFIEEICDSHKPRATYSSMDAIRAPSNPDQQVAAKVAVGIHDALQGLREHLMRAVNQNWPSPNDYKEKGAR